MKRTPLDYQLLGFTWGLTAAWITVQFTHGVETAWTLVVLYFAVLGARGCMEIGKRGGVGTIGDAETTESEA